MENTKMNYESPIAQIETLNSEDVVLDSLPGYEWGDLTGRGNNEVNW